jgi:hypothetical protein
MIYLVFRTQISEQGRQDLEWLWRWVKAREPWFYAELPMVRGVKRYVTRVGPSYTVETWLAFDDMHGYADYLAKLAELRSDPDWERRRTEQERYWTFLDSRIMADAPIPPD